MSLTEGVLGDLARGQEASDFNVQVIIKLFSSFFPDQFYSLDHYFTSKFVNIFFSLGVYVVI